MQLRSGPESSEPKNSIWRIVIAIAMVVAVCVVVLKLNGGKSAMELKRAEALGRDEGLILDSDTIGLTLQLTSRNGETGGGVVNHLEGQLVYSICNDRWSDPKYCSLLCRQIGAQEPGISFNMQNMQNKPTQFPYGHAPNSWKFLHMSCPAIVSSLQQCDFNPATNCGHHEDVSCGCGASLTLEHFDGNPNPATGVVVVRTGSVGSTVCNDRWGADYCTALCRDLVCQGSGGITYNPQSRQNQPTEFPFGKAPSSMNIVHIHCPSSNPTSLKNCIFEVATNCGHHEDISCGCSS